MKQYVVGFLFSPDRRKVALIHKLRPEWQRGHYNGVGGSVEDCDYTAPEDAKGHAFLNAMIREFQEEAGVTIKNPWQAYADITSIDNHWVIHCFAAFDYAIDDLVSVTAEQVHVFQVDRLPVNTVANVPWLVHMALSLARDTCQFFSINEN